MLLVAYSQVKEIYNFTQDDLTTEDVLVLNCHNEIYVWLGCHANVGGKEQALDLAHVNIYSPHTLIFQFANFLTSYFPAVTFSLA